MTRNVPLHGPSAVVVLAVGSLVSGLLAYVFFALVARGLGAAQAAPVAVLWAYWGFAAAGVTFPVQHWIARWVAADGHEAGVRRALPRVFALSLAASLASASAAWVLREPLFVTSGVTFPLLVGGVTILSAAMGLVRGTLAARGRFAAVGGVLTVENLLRCVVAQVLLTSGVTEPAAYGGALLAGYAACLVWPSAWRLRAGTTGARAPVAFLGGAAAGQVVGQAVLTGGPVALALAGGAPREVTALFAGLALFRAPYVFAIGQVSALTTRVTEWVVSGRHRELRRVHRLLTVGTVVVALAAAGFGALVGPPALRLVFGEKAALAAGPAALVAAGTTFAMATLVLTAIVMAQDRASRIALSWLIALAPGALAYALVDAGDLERVVIAFVLVEVAAWTGLLAAARPHAPVTA